MYLALTLEGGKQMFQIQEEQSPSVLEMDSTRECTRCDGVQHLIGEFAGLGKYACDVCEMRVGFDLDGAVKEFVLHRGLPSLYTKSIYGIRLTNEEIRVN